MAEIDKQKLIRQLMATFVDELDDNVQTLDRDLLALEKAPPEQRAEIFRRLYRTVHSMKGAARSVDVTLIEGVCHRIEDVFGAIQSGHAPLDQNLFQTMFATADALGEAGQRLRDSKDLAGAALHGLIPQLEWLAKGSPSGSAEIAHFGASDESPPPPSSPTGPIVAGVVSELMTHQASSPGASQPKQSVRSQPPMPSVPSNVVRVAAEKLDSLLAQSGELLVARRRVESRVGEIATLRDTVAASRARWGDVQKPIRKLLHAEGAGDQHRADGAARVDYLSEKAEAEVAQVGDRLRRLEKDLDRLATVMVADVRQLDQACNALEHEVHRVRMLPFSEACQGLERAARDVAQSSGKEVDLVIEGGDVEMDRAILEGLKDPLLHLVRNAVDHGVQLPHERRQAGKSPRARVTVAASVRGAQVEVVVADDGRGVDVEAVRRQIAKRGWSEPADERELVRMIFQPGFSTAAMVTDVSGRGVGLDVVKARLEFLHGAVDLTYQPGRGTRFTLSVPLTLTTLRTLMFVAGGQIFALASTSIEKLIRLGLEDLRSVQGRDVVSLGGPPVPVVSLVDTLGLTAGAAKPQGKLPAIVVSAIGDRVAFVVDELLVEQEVVVKNLGQRIRRVRNLSGATLLPTGKIALVLNGGGLVRAALRRGGGRAYSAELAETGPQQRKRLIVVDDSVTTRSLVKSILEASGYDVAVAVDGLDAWKRLEDQGADLVVSDVEMPRMDGFQLAETIRASKRFHDLPVILVTALDSEEHKARGIEVGADAYLIKSAFDQRNLLQVIGQLL